jgi:hypothetical protein
VTPTVLVESALDDEDEEEPQPKSDEPLLKALELLKAKNS